jgi:uncharacterized RDD family membrane protein YckC
VLLGVAGFIIRLPLMAIFAINPARIDMVSGLPMIMGAFGIITLINIALAVAYEAYFLTTRGATLGKQVLGLKVIRSDGSGISLGVAIGRYFAQWVSALILFIGYIMAAFDSEKRALHDHICDTRVIYAK